MGKVLIIESCNQCPYVDWANPHGRDEDVTRICNHSDAVESVITIKISSANNRVVGGCPLHDEEDYILFDKYNEDE